MQNNSNKATNKLSCKNGKMSFSLHDHVAYNCVFLEIPSTALLKVEELSTSSGAQVEVFGNFICCTEALEADGTLQSTQFHKLESCVISAWLVKLQTS